ncbi:MAG TPA: urate hydroxylase PuuD [Clostridia bacterium]|nr:urate hydroxylase PuuD [Clostridia bacterium]
MYTSSVAELAPHIIFPQDANTNVLMMLRWVHFLAGIAWVGLLYFFNLVNVPLMRELDATTRGKVVPTLMPRALWWFRWASVVTVFAGVWYWMVIVGTDKRNAIAEGVNASGGAAIGSFFGIWTLASVLMIGILMMGKLNDRGVLLGVIVAVIVIAASWVFLAVNSQGWESNRLLAIGVGGGLGWVMMMNVWGIIWRAQKKLIRWTAESAAKGTPMPAEAAKLSRLAFVASRANFWLSFPMLFFMGAASHYPMFGR